MSSQNDFRTKQKYFLEIEKFYVYQNIVRHHREPQPFSQIRDGGIHRQSQSDRLLGFAVCLFAICLK